VNARARCPVRFAWLAAGVLCLIGCGRATKPNSRSGSPDDAGGTVGSGGEGGHANEATGGLAGSGEPGGGLGGGSGASGSGAGGSAGSGGASGSGGRAGAGGSAPLGDLPVPPGCQPLRGAETDLLCSIELACGAMSEPISCYHTASGPWQCTCAPPKDRAYLIDGAAGLDACAVGAGLCSQSEPALDVDGCVVTKEELGSEGRAGLGVFETCAVELSCQSTVAVDFAPGVRATVSGFGAVRCAAPLLDPPQPGPMSMSCEATGSRGSQTYAVVAEDVGEACRRVLDFHLSSKKPKFDGPRVCLLASEDLGSSSCHLVERCFDESEPLSNGVSLVEDVSSTREAGCNFDDLGELSCFCTLRSESVPAPYWDIFNIDLGPAAMPATCDFSDCTRETLAEPTGPGECQAQLYTEEHDDDTCTDEFYCSQPATLNGRAVTVRSWLNVLCKRAPDQSFYCACGAGDETGTFAVGAVPSSSDACAAARTSCLAHVSLPLGPAPYVRPILPNPVPGM
jgi:hypothetical protein